MEGHNCHTAMSHVIPSSVPEVLEYFQAFALQLQQRCNLRLCLRDSCCCLKIQVLAATKEDLSAEGVNVETLEAAAQQSGHTTAGQPVARSKTVLLLKNLPFQATEESIHELFDRDGGCIRLVLPRTRALALVELTDAHV